jgi:LysM repeat protein
MKKITVLAVLFFCRGLVAAQTITIQEYIDTYKDMAIREMQRVGIPASITLAQGILETEAGNSDLVKRSNNHFGIKCKSSWTGESVYHDDDEQGECFRKYNNAEDSYRDHSNFLRGSERYAFLFKLDPSDYKGWARGLKKAGYATNPRYPDILIKNIEQYNLQQYTAMALGEIPVQDGSSQDIIEQKVADNSGLVPVTADSLAIKKSKTQFNGLKAVYAARGTSLLVIATAYEIALSRLLDFNDLKTDGLLQENAWIYLEKKHKQGNRDFYITLNNETVYEIAQLNALQLAYLLQYNSFGEADTLKPGTKVYLRPVTKESIPAKASTMQKHEVKSKEGLYAISKKYNVTVDELKAWNKLDSENLRVGQTLIISK